MASAFTQKIKDLNEKRHNLRERIKHQPVLLFLFRGTVILIGIFLVILGLIMCVTPGPGALGIFAGLAVLSTEIPWAKVIVRKIMLVFRRVKVRIWDKKIAPKLPKKKPVTSGDSLGDNA
jgi:uncharacterized protein (TIGR02611 family)